ncbi:MAG: heme o synthase [Chthoniobacterales bacterium]
MKAATLEPVALTEAAVSAPGFARNRPVADFAELIKARLTLLVLLTPAAGFYLGVVGPLDFAALFHAIFGTAMAAAGAAALNQWWERRLDALMDRTKSRPVAAGRMRPRNAFLTGVMLGLAGVIYLGFACNLLSASLAAVTIGIYIFAYTPLKRISTANTLIGAIAGALPPMIGWAAASGSLAPGAWSLFAILFLWQMPHFFAIAWIYRADYSRAGFQMVSTDDATGERSGSQSVLFCILLLIVGGIPTFIGMTTFNYLVIELVLGGIFVAVAMRFLRMRTQRDARLLFFTSIIYLPALLIAMVLAKT